MRTIITIATLAAVPLATPAIGQTGQIAQTVEPMVPAAGAVLDVMAEGRTTRVPDIASIRAGVVSQSATAAAALSDNARRIAAVLAALRKAGVAPRDVATSTVGLSPQYRYADNQPPVITGYQATNSVTVRFREVARAGTILDTLVAQGANQIDGPNLSVDKPDAALDEARTDAVVRARARAELYAKAAGLRVARIVSIGESGQDAGGPERPPVVFARAAMAQDSTRIEPGEKDITVTLSVRFLLQ